MRQKPMPVSWESELFLLPALPFIRYADELDAGEPFTFAELAQLPVWVISGGPVVSPARGPIKREVRLAIEDNGQPLLVVGEGPGAPATAYVLPSVRELVRSFGQGLEFVEYVTRRTWLYLRADAVRCWRDPIPGTFNLVELERRRRFEQPHRPTSSAAWLTVELDRTGAVRLTSRQRVGRKRYRLRRHYPNVASWLRASGLILIPDD